MALIKCSECGKEVSDKARSCPGCGAPIAGLSSSATTPPRQPPAGLSKAEETLYDSGGILVTTARIVFPSRTYATANITSVSVHTKVVEPLKGGAKFFIAVGALLLSFGLLVDRRGAIQFGVLLLLGGIIWLIRLKNKLLYYVRIGSAGSESDGLVSGDKVLVGDISAAINDAIVKRG